MILGLKDGIDNGKNKLIDKSREVGATWIVLGTYFWYWLTQPESQFLVSSRKEEYVDKRGDHKTLFAKLMYLYDHLPNWIQPKKDKTHMHLMNEDNLSVIDGESTNPDLGAGDRRLSIMCDEFARVDHGDAQSIADTLSDTTDCIIYNSTHTNKGHPYAKLRYGKKIEVIIMPWWEHPMKRTGLYTSPSLNKIILHDVDYWRKQHGDLFDGIEQGVEFSPTDAETSALISGEEHALFVADGSGKWRSPYYDKEERRRSARDVAQNLDMNPIGSGDAVFDLPDLQRMRTDYIKAPDYKGEVEYKLDVERSKIRDFRWVAKSGHQRLSWWGNLVKDRQTGNYRPDQSHNYIVGCDISMGAGSSNSVASIYDCNTNRKVGSWVDALTAPTRFTEQVVALCLWVGGCTPQKPFLIFEANGVGVVFDKRLWALGYDFVYHQRDEKKVYRPRSGGTRGWHSSADAKQTLIYLYREALSLTFRGEKDADGRQFINPDELAIAEAEDYIFLGGSKIGPSSSQSEDSGAIATHGDRVIADALTCLGRSDQPAAASQQARVVETSSFAYRRQLYVDQNRHSEDEKRWQN